MFGDGSTYFEIFRSVLIYVKPYDYADVHVYCVCDVDVGCKQSADVGKICDCRNVHVHCFSFGDALFEMHRAGLGTEMHLKQFWVCFFNAVDMFGVFILFETVCNSSV